MAGVVSQKECHRGSHLFGLPEPSYWNFGHRINELSFVSYAYGKGRRLNYSFPLMSVPGNTAHQIIHGNHQPGEMAFTRIPYGANSTPQALVSPITACLVPQ